MGTSHLLWLKSFLGEQNWLCFRNTTSCAGLHQINPLGRLSMAEEAAVGCSSSCTWMCSLPEPGMFWPELLMGPSEEGGKSMLRTNILLQAPCALIVPAVPLPGAWEGLDYSRNPFRIRLT